MPDTLGITILMTDEDFDHLTEGSTIWADSMGHWSARMDRFETYSNNKDPVKDTPGTHWKWLHVTGPEYAALILARSFLASQGHPFEIIYDTASYREGGDDIGWCILTDYCTPDMTRAATPS